MKMNIKITSLQVTTEKLKYPKEVPVRYVVCVCDAFKPFLCDSDDDQVVITKNVVIAR